MAEAEFSPMETAAARELCRQHAEVCNVDKDDAWTFHGAEFLDDARKVLLAAGVREMLEALRYYTDAQSPGDTCGGGYYSLEDDSKVAKEAIAKATGSAA